MQWKETTVQESVSVSDMTDEELDAKINAYLLNR
jgi:hypothetical protein